MKGIFGIKIKFILFLGLMLLIYSCSQKQNSDTTNDEFEKKTIDTVNANVKYVDILNITDLIDLLGKTIDLLPDIKNYKKEKVNIEDEEGFAKWDGVKYFDGNVLIFLVESNWTNRNIVDRITLYSEQIKEDELYVGQSVGNIRKTIEGIVPTSPDGELFVKSKKYPEISIQLDVSNIPPSSPLYYGITNFSELPDSLKVESIVIMK